MSIAEARKVGCLFKFKFLLEFRCVMCPLVDLFSILTKTSHLTFRELPLPMRQDLATLKTAVQQNSKGLGENALKSLKVTLLGWDSLPPLNDATADAANERAVALEAYEQAVFFSIVCEDREAFQRAVSTLRDFYTGVKTASENQSTVLGLSLLHLLVENKLAEFHSELELLTEEQRSHPHISFCTSLDQHLMVGSYDQVMAAAAKPPVPYYTFFLKSLLETVRTNIAECAAASYSTLSMQGAAEIFMFNRLEDTRVFITEQYPEWVVEGDQIDLRAIKQAKSEEIASQRIIEQTLGYATEMERIV
eukprot:GSChrysophyteH1.ASY1.ANO1.2891.1 assembled CDS